MNSKKKTMFLILALISIVIITLGVTYAFFNYVKEGSIENSIQLGKITFIYEEVDKQGAGIALENAFPISDEVGSSQEGKGKVFHFSIKSDTITNVKIPYTITARVKEGSDLEENAVKINLKDDKGETLTESIFAKLKNAQFETIPEGVTEKVIYKGEVPENNPGYEKKFNFRMWIPEEIDFSPVPDEDGQDTYPYNNKSFRVTINVYADGKMITQPGPTIKAISSLSYTGELWAYKSEIEKVVIQNQLSEITGENVESWDISAEDSPGTVKAYYDKDTKTAYIQGDGKIDANKDSSYLFSGFSNLKEIEGLNLLDTSRVTNMSNIFYFCSHLTSLDLSSWDTSSVKDMSNMFYGCSRLTTLDLSKWETSSVTDMSSMFLKCSQLTNLDSIKDWDTSSVTDMHQMFGDCSQLISLDLSKWETSSVTSMGNMFTSCSNLTNLDSIEDWETSSVTSMGSMFSGCSQLANIDLSKWDTSSVTRMDDMFKNCSNLTNLDSIQDWDTSSVTYMGAMFYDCDNLTSLDLSGWDTSSVTDMGSMFNRCSQLTSLDLSKWDTSSVTYMSEMFYECSQLTSVGDLSKWDTSSVTNMSDMFEFCSNLTSLDLSGWNTSSVTDMSYMFGSCDNLTSIGDLSGWNTSSVTNMSGMFGSCDNLTSIGDLSSWDTSSVTKMSSMFRSCSQLTSLDLSSWDTSSVTSMSYMFNGCSQLTTTINIMMLSSKIKDYTMIFDGAATAKDTKITVNYTTENASLVEQIIRTVSGSYNVKKGTPISSYTVTVNGNEDIQASTTAGAYYPNVRVTLTSESGKTITSFEMNGKKITGNTFKMPDTDVIITNVVTES